MDQSHMRLSETPAPASPLLDRCQPSLPARSYFDPEWFALEQSRIWGRNWVYACRANDIEPMTVRRLSIGGQNLILVKDRDGATACFHNTCRHRGAELCAAEERTLKTRLITCPYHQWSYDLAGRLIRTPFVSVTDDFRKEDHGLFKVRLKEWNGFLFVCLADEPPDFDAVPDVGAHALDNWPMAELVTGHVLVKEMACNWKVFWENFNECLHCPGIHPELVDAVPIYKNGYMATNEAPGWTPDVPVVGALLKEGTKTWTLSGQACGPEFPGLTREEREAGQTFVTLFPTMFIVAHIDYVRAVSLKPLGPERTELRAEWLFPAETLAQPEFDLSNVVDFATTVLLQDGMACEMNQRGLKSDRFEAGVLMPQEFGVHRFQEWVRGQMAETGGRA